MSKFTVHSDGGSRGNPGPAAFGFIIKTKGISNFKFPRLQSLSDSFGGQVISKQIPNLLAGRQGFNIKIKNNIVYGSGYLGETTNNQAEYNGILNALKYLKSQINPSTMLGAGKSTDQPINEVECLLDSQLIVEQMNGKYKIKNEGLKPLYWEIRQLIIDLGGQVTFQHIPREQNKEADLLVNKAIDKELNIQ